MCDTKLLSNDVFIDLAEKSGLVYRDFGGSVLTPYRSYVDLTEYLVNYSEKLLEQYGVKNLSFETPSGDV